MFTFLLFFCAMQCCLFLSVSNWHGLSINYSTNRKIVNLNLVWSLAIKLPHTLKCNLQFTIIVIVIVTIVNCNNNKHQNCSHSLHQNIPPEYTVILTTWQSNLTVLSVRNDTGLVILMAQTCSLTQIFIFERWTTYFEQETGFCRKSMVFCYLYELFWEMHLLFCKCQGWFERCTKATEKNCNIKGTPGMARALDFLQVCLIHWFDLWNYNVTCRLVCAITLSVASSLEKCFVSEIQITGIFSMSLLSMKSSIYQLLR